MPRHKITSTRAKKAKVLLKRAIKRGDVPPPSDSESSGKPLRRKHNLKPREGPARGPRKEGIRSTFAKLSKEYLEETKILASSLVLPRPIPDMNAVFSLDLGYGDDAKEKPLETPRDAAGSGEGRKDDDMIQEKELDPLTCPRRPKWKYEMSKLEVERNEEEQFRKWLEKQDGIIEAWKERRAASSDALGVSTVERKEELPQPPKTKMPPSPIYFERNLDVWRQLWRVTELSQIMLLLVDSRCPLLHYPPSLASYLNTSNVPHILVLTKVDIVGPLRAAAWLAYFAKHYPGVRVVQVEAYTVQEKTAVQQGKGVFKPYIPTNFRERLVDAIQEVHQALLEPPEKLRGNPEKGIKGNPEKLAAWRPRVKVEIDWDSVKKAEGGKVGSAVGGVTVKPGGEWREGEEKEYKEEEFLTIGIIGTSFFILRFEWC